MAELSGSLESIGLAPLLRFLFGLGLSGRLTMADAGAHGTVFLEDGRVIGARFADDRGLAALEAIGLVLARGEFAFSVDGERETNLTLDARELDQVLERMATESARQAQVIPSLEAVPAVADEDDQAPDQLLLDRRAVRLLLHIDGHTSVADLARTYGLVPTLRQLTQLVELGLIQMQAPRPPERPPERPPDKPLERPAERGWPRHPAPPAGTQTPATPGPEVPRPPARGARWTQWRRPGDS